MVCFPVDLGGAAVLDMAGVSTGELALAMSTARAQSVLRIRDDGEVGKVGQLEVIGRRCNACGAT